MKSWRGWFSYGGLNLGSVSKYSWNKDDTEWGAILQYFKFNILFSFDSFIYNKIDSSPTTIKNSSHTIIILIFYGEGRDDIFRFVRGICANRYADGADTCAVVLLRSCALRLNRFHRKKCMCRKMCRNTHFILFLPMNIKAWQIKVKSKLFQKSILKRELWTTLNTLKTLMLLKHEY
jgi:hypothetical protein